MSYLVIARCPIDDVPLRLFPGTPSGARSAACYAEAVTELEALRIAHQTFDLDTSEVFNISLVTFGPDGAPTDSTVIRDYGAERFDDTFRDDNAD